VDRALVVWGLYWGDTFGSVRGWMAIGASKRAELGPGSAPAEPLL
jgi:hypothetical protein